LSITFYIAPIDKTEPATINNAQVFYWTAHQAAHEARGSEDWSDALEFEYGAASG